MAQQFFSQVYNKQKYYRNTEMTQTGIFITQNSKQSKGPSINHTYK